MMKRATHSVNKKLAAIPHETILRELNRRTRAAEAMMRRLTRYRNELAALDAEMSALQGRGAFPDSSNGDGRGAGPPVSRVVRLVLDEYGVDRGELVSPSRHQSVVRARQLCMYLARRLCRCSLDDIGEQLGGRDHATVIHGIRMVEWRAAQNPEFSSELERLCGLLSIDSDSKRSRSQPRTR